MNILQVTPYFAPAWAYGGPPRVVFELSRELVKLGHTVTVVTTDTCDSRQRLEDGHELLDGVEVYRLRNLSNRLAWKQQAFLPLGMRSFFQRAPHYDVIHMHMFRTTLNVAAHRFSLRSGTPYVLSAHGSLPRIMRQKTVKKLFDLAAGDRILRDARALVALSRVEKADYQSAGISGSNIELISNGIDTSPYQNLPLRGAFAKSFGLDGKRLVTYLGRLNARKGLDELLLAFRDVTRVHDDLCLVVAGPDDGYKERLTKLSGRLLISNRVVFTGFLPPSLKLQLLIDSELVVYPAPREPFGLVPFEALLCGKPVVVSRDSGCGELLAEADAAFTVPPGDPVLLREALLLGLGQNSTTREMVRRGRVLVTERLNWSRVVRAFERTYQAAAAATSPT